VFSQAYEAPVRDAEFLIYDGFFNPQDKRQQQEVRRATEQDLAESHFLFADQRLNELLFRYRARNFPDSLSSIEQAQWQEFRHTRLHSKISDDWLTRDSYLASIAELEKTHSAEPEKMAILSALRTWELEVN
jgi:exodeoxyribonuclease-1